MDLSELISKKVKKMGIAELINKEKKNSIFFRGSSTVERYWN